MDSWPISTSISNCLAFANPLDPVAEGSLLDTRINGANIFKRHRWLVRERALEHVGVGNFLFRGWFLLLPRLRRRPCYCLSDLLASPLSPCASAALVFWKADKAELPQLAIAALLALFFSGRQFLLQAEKKQEGDMGESGGNGRHTHVRAWQRGSAAASPRQTCHHD